MTFFHNTAVDGSFLSHAVLEPAEGETVGYLGFHLTDAYGNATGGVLQVVHDEQIRASAASMMHIAHISHPNDTGAAFIELVSYFGYAIMDGNSRMAVAVGNALQNLVGFPSAMLLVGVLDEGHAVTSEDDFELLSGSDKSVSDSEIELTRIIQSVLHGTVQ